MTGAITDAGSSPHLHTASPAWSQWSLTDHLPAPSPLSESWPTLALGVIAIYLICYLAHYPGSQTQLFKAALLPVALGAPVWFWLTTDMSSEHQLWNAYYGLLTAGVSSSGTSLRADELALEAWVMEDADWPARMSAAVRWTRSNTAPTYTSPTHPPALGFLRRYTWFKALLLIPAESYNVFSGPSPKTQQSYLSSVGYHFLQAGLLYLAWDVVTFLPYRLDPTNLGNPHGMRRHPKVFSWAEGVGRISARLGIPAWTTEIVLVLTWGVRLWVGMTMTWHIHAFIFLGLGIYAPEEWTKFTDKPFLSTSMIELWGRRYHQASQSASRDLKRPSLMILQSLRNVFYTLSLPLAFLPKHLAFFRIFLASAIWHMLILYPWTGTFGLRSNLELFMTCATACWLEWLFFKTTGRKVGGWAGRMWMVAILVGAARRNVVELYEAGWAGKGREDLQESGSLVEMLADWLGLWTAGP